jgi:hypothetical protein
MLQALKVSPETRKEISTAHPQLNPRKRARRRTQKAKLQYEPQRKRSWRMNHQFVGPHNQQGLQHNIVYKFDYSMEVPCDQLFRPRRLSTKMFALGLIVS